jgi:uncharacterized protein involved in copper resistance
MYERRSKFLGALAVALVTTACGPSDTANGTKGKTNPASDQAAKAPQSDQGATSHPGPGPDHQTMGPGMSHEDMNHDGMDDAKEGSRQ